MPGELHSLIAEADRYSRMTMNKHGKQAPVMIASRPEELTLFTPDGLTDKGMKDDFANKIILITGSHSATAVVLTVESWLMRARPDQPLDQRSPSKPLNRAEVVVLICQAQDGEHRTHLPSIHHSIFEPMKMHKPVSLLVAWAAWLVGSMTLLSDNSDTSNSQMVAPEANEPLPVSSTQDLANSKHCLMKAIERALQGLRGETRNIFISNQSDWVELF